MVPKSIVTLPFATLDLLVQRRGVGLRSRARQTQSRDDGRRRAFHAGERERLKSFTPRA